MELTLSQIKAYKENGFIVLPNLFSKDEIGSLTNELTVFSTNYLELVIWEKDKKHIRSLFSVHLKSAIYKQLSRQVRLVRPVQQLLNDDIYLQQSQCR